MTMAAQPAVTVHTTLSTDNKRATWTSSRSRCSADDALRTGTDAMARPFRDADQTSRHTSSLEAPIVASSAALEGRSETSRRAWSQRVDRTEKLRGDRAIHPLERHRDVVDAIGSRDLANEVERHELVVEIPRVAELVEPAGERVPHATGQQAADARDQPHRHVVDGRGGGCRHRP